MILRVIKDFKLANKCFEGMDLEPVDCPDTEFKVGDVLDLKIRYIKSGCIDFILAMGQNFASTLEPPRRICPLNEVLSFLPFVESLNL